MEFMQNFGSDVVTLTVLDNGYTSFKVNGSYTREPSQNRIAITKWLLKLWKQELQQCDYLYCVPIVDEKGGWREAIYLRLGFVADEYTCRLQYYGPNYQDKVEVWDDPIILQEAEVPSNPIYIMPEEITPPTFMDRVVEGLTLSALVVLTFCVSQAYLNPPPSSSHACTQQAHNNSCH